MTNDELSPNDQMTKKIAARIFLGFVIPSSFVIRASSFFPRHLSLNLGASSRTLDKRARRVTDFLSHTRLGRNKFRCKPRKQADQIVRDQNLSIAMLA